MTRSDAQGGESRLGTATLVDAPGGGRIWRCHAAGPSRRERPGSHHRSPGVSTCERSAASRGRDSCRRERRGHRASRAGARSRHVARLVSASLAGVCEAVPSICGAECHAGDVPSSTRGATKWAGDLPIGTRHLAVRPLLHTPWAGHRAGVSSPAGSETATRRRGDRHGRPHADPPGHDFGSRLRVLRRRNGRHQLLASAAWNRSDGRKAARRSSLRWRGNGRPVRGGIPAPRRGSRSTCEGGVAHRPTGRRMPWLLDHASPGRVARARVIAVLRGRQSEPRFLSRCTGPAIHVGREPAGTSIAVSRWVELPKGSDALRESA